MVAKHQLAAAYVYRVTKATTAVKHAHLVSLVLVAIRRVNVQSEAVVIQCLVLVLQIVLRVGGEINVISHAPMVSLARVVFMNVHVDLANVINRMEYACVLLEGQEPNVIKNVPLVIGELAVKTLVDVKHLVAVIL